MSLGLSGEAHTKGTAREPESLWVRGAHSQALVPSRPWSSRVRDHRSQDKWALVVQGMFAVPGTLCPQSCHQPAAQGWEAGLPFQQDLPSRPA